MTNATASSTITTTSADEIYSLLSTLSDEQLADAKRSHGWSVVVDNLIRCARERGIDWRDLLGAAEAWALTLPLPDDAQAQIACAALHGLYDGMVTGRLDPCAELGDVQDQILAACGFEALAENLETKGVSLSLLVIHSIVSTTLRAELAEKAVIRPSTRLQGFGTDGVSAAWYEAAEGLRELACFAWEDGEFGDTDSEALCASLAEALRVAARKAVQS
jgi:hypothetical protein